VNHKLTLNLGLRYEIQTAPTERVNAQEFFDFKALNPISSAAGLPVYGAITYNNKSNRSLYHTQYLNFAPRVGAAYQFSQKLVGRAGFGIFYVPNYYNQGPNLGYSQPTPWVTSLDGITVDNRLSNAFPNGQVPVTGNSLGQLTGVGFNVNPVIDPKRPSAYVEQWMGGLQYSPTNNDLIDITYFGNHGVHVLAQYFQSNQLPTPNLALGNQLFDQVPNPFFGHITNSGCGLDRPTVQRFQLLRPYPEFCDVTQANGVPVGGSTYNALQLTYTHRWHSGLNVNVSYTYSKFVDNVQGASGWAFPGNGSDVRDFTNLAAERSRDVSDIPHSLVVNYIYELPIGKGKALGSSWSGPVNQILGGWQLTGIFTAKSGFPLIIRPQSSTLGVFNMNQRPDLVGDPRPNHQSIDDWISAAAFAQPAAFTLGNAPRTITEVRSPRYINFDIGIQKYWDFSEAKRLQFRFEMFNAFNHANFFAPDMNLANSTFGKISQAYPSRDIQAALKFYW
jgi:hypothetical protein